MISEEINRIKTAKADIKTAIEGKGITVSSSAKIDDYASLIDDIGSGSVINSILESEYDTTLLGTTFDIKSVITEVHIPEGITSINLRTFSNCKSLKEVTIPSTITSIGDYTFENCSAVEKVNWKYCSGLTSTGGSMFRNCTKLNNVIIPNNITIIKGAAFNSCTSLTNISLSSNLELIESSSFGGCSSLQYIKIPDTVTSIGLRAFENSGLVNIEFENGSQLTDISLYAFNCPNINSITFTSVIPPTVQAPFINGNIQTIYVPASSVSAYQSASGWSSFASKILAIPTS